MKSRNALFILLNLFLWCTPPFFPLWGDTLVSFNGEVRYSALTLTHEASTLVEEEQISGGSFMIFQGGWAGITLKGFLYPPQDSLDWAGEIFSGASFRMGDDSLGLILTAGLFTSFDSYSDDQSGTWLRIRYGPEIEAGGYLSSGGRLLLTLGLRFNWTLHGWESRNLGIPPVIKGLTTGVSAGLGILF